MLISAASTHCPWLNSNTGRVPDIHPLNFSPTWMPVYYLSILKIKCYHNIFLHRLWKIIISTTSTHCPWLNSYTGRVSDIYLFFVQLWLNARMLISAASTHCPWLNSYTGRVPDTSLHSLDSCGWIHDAYIRRVYALSLVKFKHGACAWYTSFEFLSYLDACLLSVNTQNQMLSQHLPPPIMKDNYIHHVYALSLVKFIHGACVWYISFLRSVVVECKDANIRRVYALSLVKFIHGACAWYILAFFR